MNAAMCYSLESYQFVSKMFNQVRGSVKYTCLNKDHFISVGAEGGYIAVFYGSSTCDRQYEIVNPLCIDVMSLSVLTCTTFLQNRHQGTSTLINLLTYKVMNL